MKVNLLAILWVLLLLFCCQSNPYIQGERLYLAYCASCHMENGEGLKSLYPPLAQSDYLKQQYDVIPCIIVNGLSDTIQVNGKTYELPMTPIKGLTTVQITNIINYISQAWGNDAGYTKIQDVEKALSNCPL